MILVFTIAADEANIEHENQTDEGLFIDEEKQETPNAITPDLESDKDYDFVTKNEYLELHLDLETTSFYVKDIESGKIWHSNPPERMEDPYASGIHRMEMSSLMIIYYSDRKTGQRSRFNTWTGSAISGDFEITETNNGFRTEYYFPNFDTKIPLEVYISGKNLIADVIIDEMEVDDPDLFISSISVLPFFGAGYYDNDGYIFVPDGTGALIRFNNGKYSSRAYERPIYGINLTEHTGVLNENLEKYALRMPVLGIKENGKAMFAVIEDGAENASIKAYTNMQQTGYANVFADFHLKSRMNYSIGVSEAIIYERGEIQIPKLSIRYSFLSGEEANYSGMAKVYRNYLVEKHGFTKNENKVAFFVDLYAGVVKERSRMGIIMDKTVPLTTTEQIEKIIQDLNNEKVDNIVVNYNNWNDDELSGKIPVSASSDSSINIRGNSIDNWAQRRDVMFYPSVNRMLSFSKGRNIFSRFFDSVSDLGGVAVRLHEPNPGIGEKQQDDPFYLLTVAKMKRYADRFFENMEKENINSIGFSDISNTLYSDYRTETVKRDITVSVIEEILENATGKFDYILMDNPNIYAVKYANDIINAPVFSSRHDLIDCEIPFYGMIMSSFVRYAASAMNGVIIGENTFLKLLETGSMPTYSWIYEDTTLLKNTDLSYLFSADYNYWLEEAAGQYAIIKNINKLSENTPIHSHEIINEFVAVTEYENGLKVFVNYGTDSYITDSGNSVPAGGFFAQAGGNNE